MNFPGTLNYWVLQTIAMFVTALLVPRLKITSIFGALITVVALAFVNATVWDAALFASIPDSFSLHALSLLVSNGVLFWVLVKVLPGIEIEGALPAIVAPLVFTVCSLLISEYGKDIDWIAVFNQGAEIVRGVRDHFQQSGAAEVGSSLAQ